MLRSALLLVLTFVISVGPARADKPVKMMTSTWSPYVDPELPEQGLAMELEQSLKDRRDELEVASISLPPRGLYVAGSRATERPARLVEEFNTALIEVKRDGSYQKIIEKWQQRYPL